MVRGIARRAVALASVSLMVSWASAQEVTRSGVSQLIGVPRALTELSRQFFAETPFTVNFAFDRDELDAVARGRLDQQAIWIIAHQGIRFSVYGHTDLVGSNAYNMNLGLRRATAVVTYLVSKGVHPDQLDILLSLGESVPVVFTEDPNEINRRAATYVAGYVSDRPGNAASVLPGNTTDDPPPVIVPGDGDDGDDGDGGDDCFVPYSTTSAGCDEDGGDDGEDGGKPGRDRVDAGRGNGDETGDPGKSEGRNNGGDEVDGWFGKSHRDSGRGNGDEDGDPGRSEGRNNGGDEDPSPTGKGWGRR